MTQARNRWLALVPVAALTVAACAESTGPGQNVEPLDAVTANQQAQSITTSFEQNPALPSLELLETTTPILGGSGAALLLQAASPFSPGADGQGLRERLERLARSAGPYLSSAEPAVIIPADLLGKVLVYNPTSGEYEVDPTQSGPANGVRIMLYAKDPVFERPTGSPVGHADFLDVSTPAEDALNILVVLDALNGGNPIIDYTARASVEVLGGVTVVFGARGYVMDVEGGRQLDFDLEQRISERETIELKYELTATNNGITVTYEAKAPGLTGGVDFKLTVSNGQESLVLTLNVSEAGISGRLDLPGDTPSDILIEAHGEEWSISHEGGEEITEPEAQAIRNMFRLLERIEHVVRKLLRPAHRILNVPIFAID